MVDSFISSSQFIVPGEIDCRVTHSAEAIQQDLIRKYGVNVWISECIQDINDDDEQEDSDYRE